MSKEEGNADYFLQAESKQGILNITLEEAVENHAEQLTLKESGCEYMFNEGKTEQLTLMYKVYSRVEKTLKFIINKMNPYIMQEGSKIVNNEENRKDPLEFTSKLLAFKEQMDKLIEEAFNNDMRF